MLLEENKLRYLHYVPLVAPIRDAHHFTQSGHEKYASDIITHLFEELYECIFVSDIMCMNSRNSIERLPSENQKTRDNSHSAGIIVNVVDAQVPRLHETQ